MTFAWSTASARSSCRLAPRLREGGKRWRYSRRPLPIAPRGGFWSRATRCSGIASSPASSALPPHRSRARASRVVRRTPRVADAGLAAHRAPHRCPLKRRGGSEPPGPPAAFPQSPSSDIGAVLDALRRLVLTPRALAMLAKACEQRSTGRHNCLAFQRAIAPSLVRPLSLRSPARIVVRIRSCVKPSAFIKHLHNPPRGTCPASHVRAWP